MASEATTVFVVRIEAHASGPVGGIVERVKTGEKQRFEGMTAIGPLIAEMLRREGSELPAEPKGDAP